MLFFYRHQWTWKDEKLALKINLGRCTYTSRFLDTDHKLFMTLKRSMRNPFPLWVLFYFILLFCLSVNDAIKKMKYQVHLLFLTPFKASFTLKFRYLRSFWIFTNKVLNSASSEKMNFAMFYLCTTWGLALFLTKYGIMRLAFYESDNYYLNLLLLVVL